jgi:hypothetical protein
MKENLPPPDKWIRRFGLKHRRLKAKIRDEFSKRQLIRAKKFEIATNISPQSHLTRPPLPRSFASNSFRVAESFLGKIEGDTESDLDTEKLVVIARAEMILATLDDNRQKRIA